MKIENLTSASDGHDAKETTPLTTGFYPNLLRQHLGKIEIPQRAEQITNLTQ